MNPRCSTLIQLPGRVTEGGSSAWAPATNMGEAAGPHFGLVEALLLICLSLFVSLCNSNFQINKSSKKKKKEKWSIPTYSSVPRIPGTSVGGWSTVAFSVSQLMDTWKPFPKFPLQTENVVLESETQVEGWLTSTFSELKAIVHRHLPQCEIVSRTARALAVTQSSSYSSFPTYSNSAKPIPTFLFCKW